MQPHDPRTAMHASPYGQQLAQGVANMRLAQPPVVNGVQRPQPVPPMGIAPSTVPPRPAMRPSPPNAGVMRPSPPIRPTAVPQYQHTSSAPMAPPNYISPAQPPRPGLRPAVSSPIRPGMPPPQQYSMAPPMPLRPALAQPAVPTQQPQQQPQQQQPLAPPRPGLMAPPRPGMGPPASQLGAPPPPPTNAAAATPGYAQRPAYPQPGGGAMAMRPPPPGATNARPAPMRPLPPGANGAVPPPVPGAMGPTQASPVQKASPGAASQLPSSAMPRPCAVESKCGTPRVHFYRGLIANLEGSTGAAVIPTSNSDYISVDDGSAPLRYMRLTTNAIATDPAVMAKAGVPLAVVMSPFADPVPGESAVPVVDFSAPDGRGAGGPLRCDKCRAYANPGFKFISGGSQFVCNMCRATCDTPTEHYSPISPANGLRVDVDTRHELRFGSVDYLVGNKDYQIREPKPAAYIFAVDVSATAITSGLAAASLFSIRLALSAGLLPGAAQGARVAVFTFDDSLHFYDARGSQEGRSVGVHVVPDVLDPFVPLGGDGFLLTPADAARAIDTIIETHGLDAAGAARRAQNPQQAPSAGCALGSALQAILTALGDVGGKAFVMAGGIPSAGVNKLERRGGGAVSGGEEREMKLMKPASDAYETLGCELAEKQISVDLFLAPTASYIDAATLVRVPRNCGGRLFMYPGFDRARDAAILHRALCTAISSVRAFDSLMRVRTSAGLDIVGEYVGHFGRPQRGDDVSGPVFDSTQATALEITVASKLAEGGGGGRAYAGGSSLFDDACVQCAVLYTDAGGRRRIRVHTMFANKTSVLADVFRLADVDATVSFLAKKAASAVFANGTPISKAREALVEKTVQSLFVYRKRCTSTSMSGQLILPEALKTLPVIVLGLTKSAAFRSSANAMTAAEAVSVDERTAALAYLVSAAPADIASMGYPRMWEMHTLAPEAGVKLPARDAAVVGGVEGGRGEGSLEPIALPNTIALTSGSLGEGRVLLIENGVRMVCWLGDKVTKEAANDVIGQVAGGRLVIRAETAGSGELLKGASDKGRRVAACVERVVRARPWMARVDVVVRGAAGAGGGREARALLPLLIEDRAANGAHSYVEFLRYVHKKVMNRVANESAQNEMQTWEMLNHGY